MKFLHCADVHLDSPMRGLPRGEWTPSDRLRGATRRALARLVDLALEEAVELVVVAGDLYDGDRDDYNTAVFLQRQLHRLRDAGVPVAVALGNHDAASEITRRLRLPDSVHVFPTDGPGSLEIEGAGVVLHGQSYPTRAVVDDLSARYPKPVPGALNVGVLHTALDGRPGHDPYAPCTLDGLVRRGYEYWALGHVHSREHSVREGVHVLFPGNLQGRHANESGPKGATVVRYEGDAVVSVEPRELAPVRFERVQLDSSQSKTVDEALEDAVTACERLPSSRVTELVAARVVLLVSPAVCDEWSRDRERLEAQIRVDACGGGEELWLERVEVRAVRGDRRTAPDDALEAVTAAFEAIRSDPSRRAELMGALASLRGRIGAEADALRALGTTVLDEEGTDELLLQCEALLLAALGGGS
ncbi:MAG: DNA repair exonuclease [Actinomycetota bacterium]|nr:DNA repair exonuclease [Actinomycetota bacterium]